MLSLPWEKIDNDVIFHRLINEIFLDECGFSGYTPGNPTGGADRGWDGKFNSDSSGAFFHAGFFRFLGVANSKWMVQVKHTGKENKPALTWLKKCLTNPSKGLPEIQKAEQQGAKHLCVVTNAPLQPDYVDQLEGLAAGTKLASIEVLSRTKLESLLLRKPWIQKQFFGGSANPSLARQDDAHDQFLDLADLSFIGRESELEDLKALLGADSGPRVILIHGLGGAGKTRFITEFARQAPVLVPDVYIRFNRKLALARDIAAEVDSSQPLRIVIDDAERRFDEEVRELAQITQARNSRIRLVLLSRTGPHEGLRTKLSSLGVVVSDGAILELEPIAAGQRLELIKQATDLSDRHAEELQRQCGANLFLLAYAVGQLQRGVEPSTLFSGQPLRSRIVSRLEEQSQAALKHIQLELPPAFLPAAAALVPLNVSDSALKLLTAIDALPEQKSLTDFRLIVDQLIQAKVLRLVGGAVRFSSDVLGDLVLAETITRQPPRYLRQMVEVILAAENLAILDNLVASTRALDDVTPVTNIFRQTLSQWTEALPVASWSDRHGWLEKTKMLAYFASDEAIDFAERAMVVPIAHRDSIFSSLPGMSRRQGKPHSTDEIGPILRNAARHAEFVPRSLRVLRHAESACFDGTYDNNRVHSIIREMHNPIQTPNRAAIEAGLGELATWIAEPEPDSQAVGFVFLGVSTVLMASFRETTWGIGVVEWRDFALPPSEPFLAVRERALGIALSAVSHSSAAVRRACADILSELGKNKHGTQAHPEMRKYILAERTRLLDAWESQLSQEDNYAVLACIARSLWYCWLLRREPDDLLKRLLRVIPRPIEFMAFEAAAHRQDALDDVDRLLAEAVDKVDRWFWWVQYRRGGSAGFLAYDERIAQGVLERYSTPPEIVGLLNLLDSHGLAIDGAVFWLRAAVKQRPSLFLEMIGDKSFFDSLSSQWKHEIRQACATLLPEALDVFVSQTDDFAQAPSEEVWPVLRAISQPSDTLSVERRRELLLALARNRNASVRQSLLRMPMHFRYVSASAALEVIATIVTQGLDEHEALLAMQTVEYGVVDSWDGVSRAPLANAMVGLAQKDGTFWWSPSHTRLLLWSIKGDMEELLNVVEARLQEGKLFRECIYWFDRSDRNEGLLVIDTSSIGHVVERLYCWGMDQYIDEGEATDFLVKFASAAPEKLLVKYLESDSTRPVPERLYVHVDLLQALDFENALPRWLSFLREMQSVDVVDENGWQRIALSFARCAVDRQGGVSTGDGETPAKLRRRRESLEAVLKDSALYFQARDVLQRAISTIEQDEAFWRQDAERFRDPR